MAVLGTNKPTLLSQIKRDNTITIIKLKQLLNTYEDLTIPDLATVLDPKVVKDLKDSLRDPQEKQMFENISSQMNPMPFDVPSLKALLKKVNQYKTRYPNSPKANEIDKFHTDLKDMIEKIEEAEHIAAEKEREQAKWNALNRNSYTSLQNYKAQFPDSVHKEELDDLMWALTLRPVSLNNLYRYLNDWPEGRHASEVNDTINLFAEWNNIKHTGTLIEIANYYSKHKNSPLASEINRKLLELKERELGRMKKNPADYSLEIINELMESNVFSKYELIDEGLMTEESYEALSSLEREAFTNIQELQVEDPDIEAPAECTDIYLFGTPGTGKTCLLMGLAKTNGKGYTLNMKEAGGPYASALQEYVNAGITPGRTFGQFVTVIHGTIRNEIKERKLFRSTVKVVNHPINLVEMSGEEFAFRIAENKSVSLADMGTGATNLLRNKNRKVFFIIVDCSGDRIKVEKMEDVIRDGEVVDQRLRKRYVSQLDILNKFVGLFSIKENQEIMKNVDSIHFVVTKSDLLGDNPADREAKAVELLRDMYLGPVESLKQYCRESKRINYSSDFIPHVFAFSLGNFYLGDIFTFQERDTLEIVKAMRAVTCGVKEESFIDVLKKKLG